jgi:hypothetical protein
MWFETRKSATVAIQPAVIRENLISAMTIDDITVMSYSGVPSVLEARVSSSSRKRGFCRRHQRQPMSLSSTGLGMRRGGHRDPLLKIIR